MFTSERPNYSLALFSSFICDLTEAHSVKSDHRVSLNASGFSCFLSNNVDYAAHEIFYALTERIFPLLCRVSHLEFIKAMNIE